MDFRAGASAQATNNFAKVNAGSKNQSQQLTAMEFDEAKETLESKYTNSSLSDL